MRTIDVHSHIVPEQIRRLKDGGDWHGFVAETNPQGRSFLVNGSRRNWLHPKYLWTPEQRLADLDSRQVDVEVLTTWSQLYHYDLPLELCLKTARDCNDYLAELSRAWPQHFVGLATLPMQDVPAAIAELERAMQQGLKGAMINDHVNGRLLDEPEFLPFWQAVEQLDALILFHQVEEDTLVNYRTHRYTLGNAIGNLADRAVTFASLVFSGIMDKYPNLKICLLHGGGYACFVGRMDHAWLVRPEARANIQQPPSQYLNRFYYDCLTHDEGMLRMLIDRAGIDRLFLGSDWPYDMGFDSPVEWVNDLTSLTRAEKDAILGGNLAGLLGL